MSCTWSASGLFPLHLSTFHQTGIADRFQSMGIGVDRADRPLFVAGQQTSDDGALRWEQLTGN